jgi:hypothetical protein
MHDNHEDMSWIGCGNEVTCGKWFHQFCLKMSDEDYYQYTTNDEEWFCDDCRIDQLKTKNNHNS